jgi:hypothetical protein
MRTLAAVVLGIAFVGASSTAHASAIIFDGGLPVHSFVYFADADYTFTEAAFPFSILPGDTVARAEWWGGCFPSATKDPASPPSGSGSNDCPSGDFTLKFYADGVGEPGALIQSFAVGSAGQTATGDAIGSGDFITEYFYSADFAPPPLLPFATYWFAISNNVSGTTWGWESAGGEETHLQFNQETPAWTSQLDSLAFRLRGPEVAPVPEPGMISLLAVGLGGLMLSRFRRHRR